MLRRATVEDIGFIRSLTTRADYAPFIGDADAAQLLAWIESPASDVVIWEAGPSRGFAIFHGLGAPGGVVELFRLALEPAGGGHGRAFLAALVDHAFRVLNAARLWLDASAENPRAVTTYLRAGFQLEGTLRGHWYRPVLGRVVDLHIMGLMRADWEALEPGGAEA